MSFEVEREGRFSRAEAVLGQFLALREGSESVSFAEWCKQYHEIESELQVLYQECAQVDAVLAPQEGDVEPARGPSRSTALEFIAGRPNRYQDYRFLRPIGRGGMGEVVAVADQVLQRELAMKVIRSDAAVRHPEPVPGAVDIQTRFLAEARITSQLAHPGIVPVHEIGVDPEGRPYFTMKHVEGMDLSAVLDRVHRGDAEWPVHKALNVILRICDAVAYAHSRGVVHRDLKPANIRVGRFGEVYVMDWGLAKVQAAPAPSASPSEPSQSVPIDDSPAIEPETRQGAIIGTPAYMSPEQARGEHESIDRRTDIYAIGAMLYELLSGRRPYADFPGAESPTRIRELALEGPPTALTTISPQASPELIAICHKAMERDREARYQFVESLKADLEAFMDQRVVHAYASGALAEIRKWFQRNRAAAAFGAVSLMLIGASLGAYGAKRAEGAVLERRATVLADKRELDALKRAADELWPVTSKLEAEMEEWILRADALLAKLPAYEAAALATSDSLASGANAPPPNSSGGSAADEVLALHDEKAREVVLAGLRSFQKQQHGDHGTGKEPTWVKSIPKRLALARAVRERTLTSASARGAWEHAIASIAEGDSNPAYRGLTLAPIEGLLPIGHDPASGLWEFCCCVSGDPPERRNDGTLVLKPESGLVLVLIPPGTCTIGAQADDPSRSNYDGLANVNEGPVHSVGLDAYFISKYEMTQEQWYRTLGSRPSHYYGAGDFPPPWSPALHPVEGVSWEDCQQALQRLGLELPTEAQWEHAARAGDSRPWSGVRAPDELRSKGNVFDSSVAAALALFSSWELSAPKGWLQAEAWTDGHPLHAPVDAQEPNAFGLHGTIGNVMEWCRDYYGPYTAKTKAGSGLRTPKARRSHVVRGGCFLLPAAFARSAFRFPFGDEVNIDFVGLRPALQIETPPRR